MIRSHSPAPSAPGVVHMPVRRLNRLGTMLEEDALAVEEPLEIRLSFEQQGKRQVRSVSVTMRTPGDDESLAVGFLFTEGILQSPDQLRQVRRCIGPCLRASRNVIHVELKSGLAIDLARLERHFYTSSSCGVCGKTSIEAVTSARRQSLAKGPCVSAAVIHRLPEVLRRAQDVFDRTGGLHASALFDARGRMLDIREDVGRHNALDKLIGAEFLAGHVPLSNRLLLLSGRASFELVQKAMMAGIPMLAAVGAPSSLAVDLARDCGMTLLGFVRDGRFNLYSGEERIRDGAGIVLPSSDSFA